MCIYSGGKKSGQLLTKLIRLERSQKKIKKINKKKNHQIQLCFNLKSNMYAWNCNFLSLITILGILGMLTAVFYPRYVT